MKNILPVTFFLLGILSSCSTDENTDEQINDQSIQFSNFIIKFYDVQNGNPELVIDSTNYQLTDNRIISAGGIRFSSNLERSFNYTYTNDKLSEITEFRDGELYKRELFNYDNNNELFEYIEEFVVNSNESSYTKYEFEHTNDTIYSTQSFSDDGINFDDNLLSKHVLDINDKCTYYSGRFIIDDEDRYVETYIYDANENLITESDFAISQQSGMLEPSIVNQIIPNTDTNPYYLINVATYTKKTLMLLYPFKNNGVNLITASRISPNTIETFNTNFGESESIILSSSNNNITNNNEFRFYLAGNYFSKETREYYVE